MRRPKYNPHELIKSSDIRLTKRAARQRWIKTTICAGMMASCSFAKEDWKEWTGDFPSDCDVATAIANNTPIEAIRADGASITLTPPIDQFFK